MKKPLFLYVSLANKILFARHLSIMIKTGMRLVDSLKLLQKQTRSRSLSYILEQIIQDTENGQFLSVSLKKFQHIFGELFINVIRIGEISGTLSDNLEHLSIELRKSQTLRQKIRAALIYPSVVLLVTVVIVGVLIFFVLPRIIPVFSNLRISLPLSTKILIAISQFLINNWLYFILGLIAAVIIFIVLLRIKIIRFLWHKIILYLPLIGSISRKAAISNMSRTLSLMLNSGMKIVEALIITSNTLTNLVYKKALIDAAEIVKKGESFNSFLKTREDLFPIIVSQMIEVGESTGTLCDNLVYLANFYEEEVDEATKNLSSTLEPFLLVIMGVIVGFIAISIITPIYKMTQPFK